MCHAKALSFSMDISAYTLIAIANRRPKKILNPGGSILAMTYLGGETVIPGYNLMGICKAALESSMEYLANELGPQGIRVNALSAGPLRTLAASAVGEFDQIAEALHGLLTITTKRDSRRSRQDRHVLAL